MCVLVLVPPCSLGSGKEKADCGQSAKHCQRVGMLHLYSCFGLYGEVPPYLFWYSLGR